MDSVDRVSMVTGSYILMIIFSFSLYAKLILVAGIVWQVSYLMITQDTSGFDTRLLVSESSRCTAVELPEDNLAVVT